MITNLTSEQIKMLKVARVKCDIDLLFFTRFFFKLLKGTKFIPNWHHTDISKALQDIGTYKYELLNINIPPRMSKTELAINFIARALGKNPTANFLYITASDELRSEVSVRIRDIITHPYFVAMYGVELKKDQNSKNLWKTTQGGGLKTATILGQITGFGAGQFTEINELVDYIREFEGCIVLDDINKINASDVLGAENDKVTSILFNTVLSRKNSDDTPIINIQQRAGIEDATAKLIQHYESTDSVHKVKNLVFPVLIDGKSLWENKMPLSKIYELRDSPYTQRTFETQYMQNPVGKEGMYISREWFPIVPATILPSHVQKKMIIDGAYTKNTKNDPSGILIYSEYNGKIYIHNFIQKWYTLSELLENFPNICNANNFETHHQIWIEPKASGKDIISMFRNIYRNPVNEINSEFVTVSKIERAQTSAPYIQSGLVCMIEGTWNKLYLDEITTFPNGKHDETIDCTAYAIEKELIKRGSFTIKA
jgi:predicted phage terminase large subunit-like protein